MKGAKHQKSLITTYTYNPALVHRRRYTTIGVHGPALALFRRPSIMPRLTLLLPLGRGPFRPHLDQVRLPHKYKVRFGPLLPHIIEGLLRYGPRLRVEYLSACGFVTRVPRVHFFAK